MVAAGFNIYPEEWWHYTLKNEPYPNEYFDFEVNVDEAGRTSAMDEVVRRAIEQARRTMNENLGGPFGAAIIDSRGQPCVRGLKLGVGRQRPNSPCRGKCHTPCLPNPWDI